MNKFVETARKIINEVIDIKSGEKVCLVKDHSSKIVDAFEIILNKRNIFYELVEIPFDRANSSPIPEATEAFERCDVIIAPTSKSISHCQETTNARKLGKRAATLPGITEEIFLKVLDSNVEDMVNINLKIYEQVKDAKEIIITTTNGTNISIKLSQERKWDPSGMSAKNPGDLCNIPDGEIYCAPLEDGANGKIVIDAWEKLRTKDDAILEVKEGKIVSWSDSANIYVDRLKTSGESGLIIAELGIGTNKAHLTPIGNILHDEKIYKSAHIAFGMNISFGGSNTAKVHEDIILMNPTILIDGKKLEY